MLALIAVFLACFFDWRQYLGPGEIGTIMVIAQDRTRRAHHHALRPRPAAGGADAQTADHRHHAGKHHARNNIVIEVHTASYRSVRGYTVVAALLDEIAYWPIDENASEPDVEIINAIKPAMAHDSRRAPALRIFTS